MIVCVCRAVSDRTVRAAISAGAQTVAQVGAACRAGTSCGTCKSQIAALLAEARAARAVGNVAAAANSVAAAKSVASGHSGAAACCAPAAEDVHGRCASPLAAVASAAL